MTTKKIQLNPLAKNLLLKHRMLVQKSEYDEDGTWMPATGLYASNLVKFVMVSKSFLHISQRDKIYEFLVNYCDKSTDYMFSCAFNADYLKLGTSDFHLTFEELYTLVKFLRPQQIAFSLGSVQGFEAIEQSKKVLELAEGKIELFCTGYRATVVPAISILLKKHKQITVIGCLAEVLSEIDLVPRLKLDRCKLTKLITYGQLNTILQYHNIKNLTLDFDDDNYNSDLFTFEDLQTKILSAPSVETLRLETYDYPAILKKGLEDDDFLKKTKKLIQFFPNLKELKCRISFKHAWDFLATENLDDLILNLYNDCRQIQKTLPQGTNLEFDLKNPFRIRHENEYPRDWDIRLKEHHDFSDAQNSVMDHFPLGSRLRFDHEIEEENFKFSIFVEIWYWTQHD